MDELTLRQEALHASISIGPREIEVILSDAQAILYYFKGDAEEETLSRQNISAEHLFQIQERLSGETIFWRGIQSPSNWAGEVVGRVVGINFTENASRKRIQAILERLIRSGALKVGIRRDEGRRKMRETVVVGNWIKAPLAT